MLSAQVALKGGASRGAQYLAVPPHAPRYRFRSFRGTTHSSPQAVDEILVNFQGSGFKAQVHGRVARCKKAVDRSARRWRFEFSRIAGQGVGIEPIAKLPSAAHRLMLSRWLFWRFPHRIHRDFEVFEGAAPGFHRVRGHARVPVQLVDGEAAMLD